MKLAFVLSLAAAIFFAACTDEKKCPQGSYPFEGKCLIVMDGFEIKQEADEDKFHPEEEGNEKETFTEY
ncbi:MAG: hypothetical protein FJ088_09820 [Deltaproteobacteria bacterium]|nr:hypothetical protein [Deltaproteobacteria bacterium]